MQNQEIIKIIEEDEQYYISKLIQGIGAITNYETYLFNGTNMINLNKIYLEKKKISIPRPTTERLIIRINKELPPTPPPVSCANSNSGLFIILFFVFKFQWDLNLLFFRLSF